MRNLLRPTVSVTLLMSCFLVVRIEAFVVPSRGRQDHLFVHHRRRRRQQQQQQRHAPAVVVVEFVAASKKKNDDDDEEEGSSRPGMEEAFRQLEALQSLDDDVTTPPPPSSTTKKIRANVSDTPLPESTAVSPELEIAVYKDMVGELEQNEDAEAYGEIIQEMGGKSQIDDTYSSVISDLGGTPQQQTTKKAEEEFPTTLNLDGITSDETSSSVDSTDFMDSALQEALKEVKVNNPKILGTDAKSVLDNQEIMKEIQDIFEQGNEKLLASLEDIRKEQVSAGFSCWLLDCLPLHKYS